MDSHQLINQDSGNTEYYTPPEIIEAARKCMGSIDLDPFSSIIANERVKATNIFTKDDDGWEQDWCGNIWINHPFSREYNQRLYPKLMGEFAVKGNAKQVCLITYASTSEAWFYPLMANPQCFIHGRTNYYLPDGTQKKGVSKGSVVTYLGDNVEAFYEAFKDIGTVKIAYSPASR